MRPPLVAVEVEGGLSERRVDDEEDDDAAASFRLALLAARRAVLRPPVDRGFLSDSTAGSELSSSSSLVSLALWLAAITEGAAETVTEDSALVDEGDGGDRGVCSAAVLERMALV